VVCTLVFFCKCNGSIVDATALEPLELDSPKGWCNRLTHLERFYGLYGYGPERGSLAVLDSFASEYPRHPLSTFVTLRYLPPSLTSPEADSRGWTRGSETGGSSHRTDGKMGSSCVLVVHSVSCTRVRKVAKDLISPPPLFCSCLGPDRRDLLLV
jgi:hypothetical protein